MKKALDKGYDNLSVMLVKKDIQVFNELINTLTAIKIEKVLEFNPRLDKKTVGLYQDFFAASQLVEKGGLSSKDIKYGTILAQKSIEIIKDGPKAFAALEALIEIDPTLYDHTASVALISGIICKHCLSKPLNIAEQLTVIKGGLYHDLGKSCIPHNILHKPGRFTEEERNVMKNHTTFGYNELKKLISNGEKIEEEVALIALEHHEYFCGGGYPLGKRGRAEECKKDEKQFGIHQYSRIVSIADVYSALLMKRVYKDELAKEESLTIMRNEIDHYDPLIFNSFCQLVEDGKKQKLLGGEEEELLANDKIDRYRKYTA
jgi:putative nucleotidyltransferase with HDIG domain